MNYSTKELLEYADALKARVCAACHATGYENVCKIGHGGGCPIDRYLPQIVDAVLSTPRSDHISDYLPGLRERICDHCRMQDANGYCESRDLAYCGVDSFAMLVVQAVEDVRDRQRESLELATADRADHAEV